MFWNQGCRFAGNSTSYISVQNSPTLDLTGSFTIEAWVNPSTLSGVSKGIIAKGGLLGSSLRYGIRLLNTGRITLNTNGSQRLVSSAGSPLQLNTWTHIATTYDTSTSVFKIYINGILDTSVTIAGASPTSNSDSLYIGISGNTTPFNGQLDEVRIWKKALVGPEILNNRHTSLGITNSVYYTAPVLSMTFQAIDASGVYFDLSDKTINSNDGLGRNITAVNMSTGPNGIVDQNDCIEFDGNEDYLESIDSLKLKLTSTNYFTMECWIFPRNSSQGTLMYSPEAGIAIDFALYINSSGRIEANIEDEIFTSGAAGIVVPNKWTHVAFVMDEEVGKFYFNGKFIASDTAGFPNLQLGSHRLFIGGGQGSIADFNGFIDEVRIVETKISQSQIIREMYTSIDKSLHFNPTITDISYNFDGSLYDNINSGGPRMKFIGNANFSLPSTKLEKPVSPMTRKDVVDFSKGFYIKTSDKRIPATGSSGNITDSLSINKDITINDVNFFVALNHNDLSEISIVLVSPSGDSLNVFNNRTSNGKNNNLITVFDDNADSSLKSNAYTSFTPTVKAESNMNSVFGSDNAKGYWKIRVRDNNTSDTGRLYAWGIQVNNMQEREKNLNLKAFIQGFYDEPTSAMVPDTVKVYIHFYLTISLVDSTTSVIQSNGEGLFSIGNNSVFEEFPYFIRIKHRNAIETWSEIHNDLSNSIHFIGFESSYNFTTDDSKAFGNNQIPVDLTPLRYALYNGDVNHDGTIDVADGSLIDNDSFNFASGYLPTDLNGDDVIDIADAVIADNNAANFIGAITP